MAGEKGELFAISQKSTFNNMSLVLISMMCTRGLELAFVAITENLVWSMPP
jgi:hypothetical protein